MAKQMKIIDFSDGIRSEEVQHNFDALSEQLSRERLSVAGHGVSQGLDLVIRDFSLEITDGALIDKTGKEVFFDRTYMDIPLPRLIETQEEFVVSTDGEIFVSEIPYSLNQRYPLDQLNLTDINSNSYETIGISVLDFDNVLKRIDIINIEKNKITIDANSWAGQRVIVKYHYSQKRYDTIYINDNFEIDRFEGITTNSPSVSIPPNRYILGFIEVNAHYNNPETDFYGARAFVKKDLRDKRNVYTDADNNLFICGQPFNDLQIIHMVEPTPPVKENTLWYDWFANKLKVWKTIDGISDWVNVNDTSIIPVCERRIFTPDELTLSEHDLQTFQFSEDEINMHFVPNKNALEIIIENHVLMDDEYEEIVKVDPNEEYENIGIGFKLKNPLDRPTYVEVRITHRVNENPLRVRFQRTATFVEEDTVSFLAEENTTQIFNTEAPYRIKESQLEVFVDGRKLEPGTHFTEGIDLLSENRIQGQKSNQFQITIPLIDRQRVSYKITTSVYSYDHVYKIIDDIMTRLEQTEQKVEDAVTSIALYIQQTDEKMDEVTGKINALETKAEEHLEFVKKTDTLSMDNMPGLVKDFIPKGLIDEYILKEASDVIQLLNISPEDFITIFDIEGLGGNKVLRRNMDYKIERDNTSLNVYLTLSPSVVPAGHHLYITGIKLKE